MRTYMWAVGVSALSLVLAAFAVGCGEQKGPVSGTVAPAEKAETAEETGPAAAPEITQKLCPVMGNPIDQSIFVDYEGQRVYFCCQMCVDTFKKDPEKYLKKLEAQREVDRGSEGGH